MLKWTGALAAAAVVGVGVGFEANQLMKPTAPTGPETTTATATSVEEEEKVYVNMPTEQGAVTVYVKGGRITRVLPFPPDDPNFVWRLADRYRVYGPDRVLYPMKRVGWAPGGKSSIENRGKGEFVRITWDEAFDSITSEFKRIRETYGSSAFLYQPGEHGLSRFFHSRFTLGHEFMSYLGGYTTLGCDGLSWGASRSSGASIGGSMEKQVNPTEEISWFLKYSKMIVLWGQDPLTTDNHYAILEDVRLFRDSGIKVVSISPGMDETAKNFADTWIPIHPYGDEALAAAIAYTWITEGTYDQKYLDTHTVGFDEEHLPAGAPRGSSFKNYILGLSDGVPKTPAWAEPICKVRARIIEALAEEWASKPTGLMNVRGARVNAGQHIRFMWTLMAMQGLGKPGVGGYTTRASEGSAALWRDGVLGYPGASAIGEKSMPDRTGHIAPWPKKYDFYHVLPPELAAKGWVSRATTRVENKVKQVIRDVLWEVSMNASPDKPVYHRYNVGMDTALFQYPAPGYSEVHAYLSVGSNYQARSPNSNSIMRSLLNPKFEFILSVGPWMESDSYFADIILPAVTNFERNDVSKRGLYEIYSQKCIPNQGEAKSDFEIWTELSKRLGTYDQFIAGPDGKPLPTEDDWLKLFWNLTTLPNYYTWEEFKKKGYHKWEIPDTWHNWEPTNWNFKKFYENPSSAKRQTESGLIEIYSASAVKITAMGQSGYYLHEDPTISDPTTNKYESANPGPDPLCPGIATYIPNPEGPGTSTGEKYPIAVMTCHPKYAYHTNQSSIWLQDEERKEINGYLYSPIWMSKKDADARGIKYGDIVRVFNQRGQILCWAEVSERIMPGVARVYYGRWADYVERANPTSLDRSGNAEVIARGGFVSPYDTQQEVQAVAQIEKWEG
jgi:anaerobic selenocysteine-containing dehydrogenase